MSPGILAATSYLCRAKQLEMAEYSVGDALKILLARSGWGAKVHEIRIKQEWETIVGKTISRYTSQLQLLGRVLTIYTDIAPLKQELMLNKEQLINKINAHFEETVVMDIKIR